jgi:hypothetical protein
VVKGQRKVSILGVGIFSFVTELHFLAVLFYFGYGQLTKEIGPKVEPCHEDRCVPAESKRMKCQI